MNILGFEIKSKEEREQEEREYLHRIFPGGTAQKAAVEQQLKERLPREDKKAVMLYYILVKDAMTAGNGMSFEEAVEKVSKKQRILKLTPVMLEKVMALAGSEMKRLYAVGSENGGDGDAFVREEREAWTLCYRRWTGSTCHEYQHRNPRNSA